MTHLPPATSGGTLRERFIADMTVRGFTEKTRKDYLHTVAGFAAFLARSPSTATAEDIRRFQIQQSERGMNAPAMNSDRPSGLSRYRKGTFAITGVIVNVRSTCWSVITRRKEP